jgi:hypothetical protein
VNALSPSGPSGGPTVPSGRVFVSYRRSRAADTELLVQALRVHGVPTWQDVVDLGPHSTPAQIRAILADPTTAGAILWITPDLADSPFITDVEMPPIVERAKRRDGFFVQLVAAGGLDQSDAGKIASRRLGATNLAHWNVMRVASDPLDEADAASVALAVLRHRLEAIHLNLPPEAPLGLTLNVWRPSTFEPGQALQMDWSRHFSDRLPHPRAWPDLLEPALRSVAEAVAVRCPGRSLRGRGTPTLGAAVALGQRFPELAAIPLTWEQQFEGNRADWSLAVPAEGSGAIVRPEEGDPSGSVLALLVSARLRAETAFANTVESRPVQLRGVLDVRWPGAGTRAAMTPGQGVEIARRVRQELIGARDLWRLRGSGLHLFISAPAGLAVLLGQQLNTFGPLTVYEHVEESNAYAPALTIAARSA